MRGLIATISVLALSLAAGCGSSDGGSTGCAAVGDHFAACGDSKAMAQAACSATTCTDKQQAIDCVLATQCDDDSAVSACQSAQGCSLTSATCADVVQYVNGCIDELQGPASDKISEADCNAATCTGSKQQAMNCILGLQCSMSFESDTDSCRLQQGCD